MPASCACQAEFLTSADISCARCPLGGATLPAQCIWTPAGQGRPLRQGRHFALQGHLSVCCSGCMHHWQLHPSLRVAAGLHVPEPAQLGPQRAAGPARWEGPARHGSLGAGEVQPVLRPSPRKLAAGARGFGSGGGSTASSGLHGIGGGHQPSRLGFSAPLPTGNGGAAGGTPPEGLSAGWGAEEQRQRQGSQQPQAGPGAGRLADSSATLEHNVAPVLSPAGPEVLAVAMNAASGAPSGRGMQPWKGSGPAQAATAAAQLAAQQRADSVPPAGVRAEQGAGAPEPQQGVEGQWQEQRQQPGQAGDWQAHRQGELQSQSQPEGWGSQSLWEGGPAQHATAAAHSLPGANGILQRPEPGASLSPPEDEGLANTAAEAAPQQQHRQAAPRRRRAISKLAGGGGGRAAAYRSMQRPAPRAGHKRAGSHDDSPAAEQAGSAKRQRGNDTALTQEPAGQAPAGGIRDVRGDHMGADVIDSQGTDHWLLSQPGFEPASQQSRNSPEPSAAPMHHQVCSYRGLAVGRMADIYVLPWAALCCATSYVSVAGSVTQAPDEQHQTMAGPQIHLNGRRLTGTGQILMMHSTPNQSLK